MQSENNRWLMSDDFWNSAFDRNEVFRSEFLTEFRRGIVKGIENDLAWTRLAIYGVKDIALWPVLLRITELAALTPREEFV